MFDDRSVLRANPDYELVLLDRLTRAQREQVTDLDDAGRDLYGVLQPCAGAQLEVRSVSPDTALLFLSLRSPGTLPSYVSAQLGPDAASTVRRLVLDEVLQIRDGDQFVSGRSAVPVVAPVKPAISQWRNAQLSIAALRYAQELIGLDEPLLAHRLYSYGRQPISPQLRRRFPNAAGLAELVAIGDGGAARDALEQHWIPMSQEPEVGKHWRQWRAQMATVAQSERVDPRFKLYVSPDLHHLGSAVTAVAGSLPKVRGIQGFKLGRDLRGACRPDKLVVYFSRLDDLQAGAAELHARLAGCPAHGVPFTAAVTRDGLLSWGIDPAGPVQGRAAGMSWRMWIAERLAEYLVMCRAAGPATVEPWQYAMERMRVRGIDVDTWAPASRMRADAGAGVAKDRRT